MTLSENFHYLLHPEITSDILKTIPDKDLLLLRDLFRYKWPYSCQAWHLVDQVINWKNRNPNLGVRFTCPEGHWQDGTFVAIMTEFNYQIYFFTLEPSCKRLSQALKETKLIEWKKGPYICAIHEDQDEEIMKTLKKVNGEIEFDIESTCWFLSKERALNYAIKSPQNIIIQPLNPKHVPIINSIWPHKFKGSEHYLANMITMNGGFGVFTTSPNPTLCSWVTTNDFGAVAILQTIQEHKRRSYATLLVKYLTKEAAKIGLDSITYIVRKNTVSQTLFKGLGFEKTNNVRWVQFRQIECRLINAKL